MKRNYLRVYLIAVVIAGLIQLCVPGAAPVRSARAGQGKGGEVVAKPTPTPKKTTTKRNTPTRTTNNSRTNQATKSAGEAASAAEMVFWNSIKDSTNPDDYTEYLKKYPNGEFAGLAANRLKTLNAAKTLSSPTSTNPIHTNPGSPPNPPLPLHSFDFVTVTLDSYGELKIRETKSANAFTEDLGGGVKLEMVAIPPGQFMMGSLESEEGRKKFESPQHRVRIGYWFYMGTFEVTQAQWRAVMGTNPSEFKDCDECPVENISWDEAIEFCRKLSSRTTREYRLPSEAEWEYAARAGTITPFAFGETITPEIVNYDGNYPYAHAPKGKFRQKTVPGGSLGVANPFGLYDMHGNVWEWCQDWFHDSYKGGIAGDAPDDGRAWLIGGEQKARVNRGGSWATTYAHNSRSAIRSWNAPGDHISVIGFRVVAVSRTQ